MIATSRKDIKMNVLKVVIYETLINIWIASVTIETRMITMIITETVWQKAIMILTIVLMGTMINRVCTALCAF